MSKNENKKKKSSVGGVIFILIILLVAVLLLMMWKGGFGLGPGAGGDGLGTGDAIVSEAEEGEAEETAVSSETEQTEESSADTESGGNAVIVEVTDSVITADGKECADGAALKEYLLSVNAEGTVYILRDNKALKASYDEAKAVLTELGYEYSEE